MYIYYYKYYIILYCKPGRIRPGQAEFRRGERVRGFSSRQFSVHMTENCWHCSGPQRCQDIYITNYMEITVFNIHIYICIRRADRPNGVLDPGSEGPISDLPIFLCAMSFSL